MKCTIFIPVEVFRREFDAKALLAIFLASRGAEVVFGHRWHVYSTARKFGKKGDFYLYNHTISKNDAEGMTDLVKLGLFIIGYEDESALNSVNYDQQVVIRQQSDGFSKFDLWLCWGNSDFNYLNNHFLKKEIFRNIGTPRSVTWGVFGEKIFKETVKLDSKLNYRNYVLVICSFSSKIFEKHLSSIIHLNEIYEEFTSHRSRVYQERVSEEYKDYEIETYHKIKKIISDILHYTDLDIVLRPYYHEELFYEKELKKINQNRIFIDNQLTVTPLILHANAVIHTGSTTAIESICFNKPTFILKSDYKRQFPITSLSSFLSTEFTSIQEFKNMLISPILQESKVDHYVTNAGNKIFYELFAKELLDLNPKVFNLPNVKTYRNLKHKQGVYKILVLLRRGKNFRYDRLKRPLIRKRHLNNLVDKIAIEMSLDKYKIRIKKIDDSTFHLF